MTMENENHEKKQLCLRWIKRNIVCTKGKYTPVKEVHTAFRKANQNIEIKLVSIII